MLRGYSSGPVCTSLFPEGSSEQVFGGDPQRQNRQMELTLPLSWPEGISMNDGIAPNSLEWIRPFRHCRLF